MKFDLIISTHSLEHFTSIDDFFKIFENNLDKNAILFIEVPHNPLELWFNARPYDSPHCLFFSKKALENMFARRNYKIVFSDYVGDDIDTVFKLMKESKEKFQYWRPNQVNIKKVLKEVIKKFIPSFVLKLRSNIINFSSDANYNNFKYGDKNSGCLRILLKK